MTPFTPHLRLLHGKDVPPTEGAQLDPHLPALMGCRRGGTNRKDVSGTISCMEQVRGRASWSLTNSLSRNEQSHHPATSLRSVVSSG